jgi:hypothetical protein
MSINPPDLSILPSATEGVAEVEVATEEAEMLLFVNILEEEARACRDPQEREKLETALAKIKKEKTNLDVTLKILLIEKDKIGFTFETAREGIDILSYTSRANLWEIQRGLASKYELELGPDEPVSGELTYSLEVGELSIELNPKHFLDILPIYHFCQESPIPVK